MLNHIRSAVKNSLIYSAGNFSTKLIGLILIPLYTDQLSTAEYGILGMVEVTTQILIAVFGLSLFSAFFRWYWDKEYTKKQNSIFFTILFFVFGVSLILILTLSLFSDSFSLLLFNNSTYSYLIKLMLITAGLETVAIVPSTLIRLQEKPVLFSTGNILRLIVSLTFTIYFVAFLDKKVEGIYQAQIIGNLSYFLFLSRFIWKNIKFSFETKILKGMIYYSLPLVFSSVSGVLLSITDRYVLKFFTDLSDVGIYNLGYKMANTIKVFLVSSINLAIFPIIFKMINDPDNKRFYSKIMTYCGYVVMFAVLGLSFFGKEIIKFLAQSVDYWDAYKVIPIISFAIFFGMLKDISFIGLHLKKKTKIIASVIISVMVLNLLLNIALIPLWKSMGAAIATLFSQITYFLIIYLYAKKYYHIPYEIPKVVKMTLLGLVLYAISLLTSNMNLCWRLILKSILLVAFPVFLYFLKFYEEIELLRLKQAWKKWSNIKKLKGNIKKINFR